MINRRMYKDDSRGVNEALNETDSLGRGITVPAQFFLQIFNNQKTKSLQRNIQMITDDPSNTFFLFDYTLGTAKEQQKHLTWDNDLLDQIGFPFIGKINVFPLGNNKIILRIENTNDHFDCRSGDIEACKS